MNILDEYYPNEWYHRHRKPKSAILIIIRGHHHHHPRQESKMLTVHVNDNPGRAIYQEFDGLNGTGNKVPPVGTVTYASDNPAVAVVDAATGALVYVAEGTAVI